MNAISSRDILDGLKQLGVRAGDLLVVHSSLSSFGHVDGGADAVVDALVGAVSPGGSVFVPTYTYAKLPFDVATTPSFDGAITEAVRRRPGASRSHHPTHSLAGVGPDAAAILKGHENTTPFGPDSPLWRLWQRDARVLLIGVDHRANSMIHVAEESLQLAYLDRTRVAPILTPDGTVKEIVIRRGGCSATFNRIDGPLRTAGQVREVLVGQSRLMLANARDIVETAAAMMRRDPAALLCDRVECEICQTAKQRVVTTPRG